MLIANCFNTLKEYTTPEKILKIWLELQKYIVGRLFAVKTLKFLEEMSTTAVC